MHLIYFLSVIVQTLLHFSKSLLSIIYVLMLMQKQQGNMLIKCFLSQYQYLFILAHLDICENLQQRKFLRCPCLCQQEHLKIDITKQSTLKRGLISFKNFMLYYLSGEMSQKIDRGVGIPKEEAKSTDKNKKFQNIWRMLFLLVSVLVVVLSNKIYLFHTLQQFKETKKGSLLNLFMFSLPFAVAYIATDYLIHYIFDDWVEKNYLREDKYHESAIKKKKSRVIVRWGFNIFYYSCTSIIGYLLIVNTKFMPPMLGGNGSVYTLVDLRYLEETTRGMQIYYFIQFGKHVGRYFCHAFITPEGNYYEYMLHHSLATFLILFSYAMDMWIPGIFVLIAHDGSDVFLAVTRMYREYRYHKKIILSCGYVLVVITWIGLRIVAFTYGVVFAGWYQYFTQIHVLTPIQEHVFSFAYLFMCFMNTLLLVMHIYWTYFIIESFISANVSQKVARHSYD